ncbi:MAG: hypothetical protein GXP01_03000 [Alphaproteobacteria bacterium]|nr:hypothetical protein [Alphaproteobacteria bacterium]
MSVLATVTARPIMAGPSVPGRIRAGQFVARIVPFSHLFRHDFEIEALNSLAMVQNVFYRPTVLAALAETGSLADQIHLVLVHGPDGVLRAFAPVSTPRGTLGAPLRLGRAFCRPHHFDATPLIDRSTPGAAEALVAALMQAGGVIFPQVDLDGKVAKLLTKAAARQGMKALSFGARDRPILSGKSNKLTKQLAGRLKRARAILTTTHGTLKYIERADRPGIEATLQAFEGMWNFGHKQNPEFLVHASSPGRFQDKWARLSDSETRPGNDLEPCFATVKTGNALYERLMSRLLRAQDDVPVIRALRLRAGTKDLAAAIVVHSGGAARLLQYGLKPHARANLAAMVLAGSALRKAGKNGGTWTLAGAGPEADRVLVPYLPQMRRFGQLVIAPPMRAEAEWALGQLARLTQSPT